eukprot:gene6572-7872_t
MSHVGNDFFSVQKWELGGLICFFGWVLCVVVCNPTIFVNFKKHGRRHRFVGFAYLLWLLFGVFGTLNFKIHCFLSYDLILGILGILLTFSAAFDFKTHKRVRNVASGTLEENATVTYDEMIEHGFYQIVNLAQIIYLHALEYSVGLMLRVVLVFVVTAPWIFRATFPVNKFSDNYTKNNSGTLVSALYRVKKYQYLLYKHFLLHGLNVSVGLDGQSLADRHYFRLYWLCLNTAYVMEFFLQTLVKKGYLRQNIMLVLNQILMLVSTAAAVRVLYHVRIWIALLSLSLNFVNRKHETDDQTPEFGYRKVLRYDQGDRDHGV